MNDFANPVGTTLEPVCPVSRSRTVAALCSVDNFQIWRCPSSATDFVWPVPSTAELKRYYDRESWFEGGEVGGYENYDSQTEHSLPLVAGVLDSFPSDGQVRYVLDVGCGYGNHLKLAADRNWKCFGVELSTHARETAIARYGSGMYIVEQPEELIPHVFDLVLMLDVIEHVADPYSLFFRLFNQGLIGPQTRLVITTPNARAADAVASPATWRYRHPPSHLVYFSARSLRVLLETLLFSNIRVSGSSPFATESASTFSDEQLGPDESLSDYAGLLCQADGSQFYAFMHERYVPGTWSKLAEYEHIPRYQFAQQFASGSRVLDFGCGTGYGASFLARIAASVVGLDIDEQALKWAAVWHDNTRLRFELRDDLGAGLADGSFDLVTCFEMIEHVDHATQIKTIENIARLLTASGKLVISTPNPAVTANYGANPYHLREMHEDEFRTLLEPFFGHVKILRQWVRPSILIASNAVPRRSTVAADRLPSDTMVEEPPAFIAICSHAPIAKLNSFCSFDSSFDFFQKELELQKTLTGLRFERYSLREKSTNSEAIAHERVAAYQRQVEAISESDKIQALRIADLESLLDERHRAFALQEKGIADFREGFAVQEQAITELRLALAEREKALSVQGQTIAEMRVGFSTQEKNIADLKAILSDKEIAFGLQEKTISEMREAFATQEATIKEFDRHRSVRDEAFAEQARTIEGLHEEFAAQEKSIDALQALLSSKQTDFDVQGLTISEMREAFATQEATIKEFDLYRSARDEAFVEQARTIDGLRQEFAEQERSIDALQALLSSKQTALALQKKLLSELHEELATQKTTLVELQDRIASKQADLSSQSIHIEAQQDALEALETDRNEYKNAVDALLDILTEVEQNRLELNTELEETRRAKSLLDSEVERQRVGFAEEAAKVAGLRKQLGILENLRVIRFARVLQGLPNSGYSAANVIYRLGIQTIPAPVRRTLAPIAARFRGKAVLPTPFQSAFRPYTLRKPKTVDSDRPRVLHAIANFMTGGSSRLVVDLIEHMGGKYEQVVVTSYIPDPPNYIGLEIVELRQLSDPGPVKELIGRFDPHIVHVHYWGDCDEPWYRQVFLAANETGRIIVQNVNTPVAPFIDVPTSRDVFVSEYVLEYFGRPSHSNAVIYPGSDFSHFQRREAASKNDCVGMVYRLESDKLSESSIDVFVKIAQLRPTVKCLIVGGGSLLEAFQARVGAAGVEHAFEFTGYVSYESLPSLYDKMDVFIAPVWKESFGQVSPFAMNMGIPVIGYDVGAIPEIVGDRSLVAPAGDSDALATIAVRLLGDDALRAKICAFNRKRAGELFSINAMIGAYGELYRDLLADKK